MTESYKVPDLADGEMHRAEEVIRGSRFIVSMAHCDSEEAAHAFLEKIRAEHAHATHNCWAFQAGRPGSTAHIGASDDGEPKGTAGRPMLTVLLHCGVGEVAAVVTRYFGGTLLGTGGLVRAYQGLVKLGLETLPVRDKRPSTVLRIRFEHRFTPHVLRVVERCAGRIIERRFEADVLLRVETALDDCESLEKAVTEVCAGRVGIEREDESYLILNANDA